MPHIDGSPSDFTRLLHIAEPIKIISPETLLKTGALQEAILKSAYFSSIATDEKGVIQIFNVGAQHMLGYSPSDVLDRLTPADISDSLELTARAQALSRELETLITPGFQALVYKAARSMEDIYELTYIHKDGHRIPAIVSVTALRDADETIIGYLLIGTDNTLQKKLEAEQAVLDRQLSQEIDAHTEDLQRFRSAMDATGDAIFLTNPQTMRYVEVNATACSMLGYSREELLHLGPQQINASSFRDMQAQYQTFVAGDLNYILTDTVLHRKDGSQLPVEAHRQAHRYKDDWTIVSVVRDVTERRRIEAEILRLNSELEDRVLRRTEELQNAYRELEAFSYSVSHDLRSPLNTINGFSALLARNISHGANERNTHYLNRIRAGTEQMSALIEGMLTLAKLSRGPLHLKAVDLSVMAHHITQELRERDPHRDVTVTIEDPLMAHGDPALLLSALNNLMDNAWKFTARQSAATLAVGSTADSQGAKVYFVRDNGAGFDMAHANKLFGTFQRLHSPDEFNGTGVGLAIVQRIISRHGGRVWAESAIGQGACFYFTLGSP